MIRTDILDRKSDIIQWISENKQKQYISAQLHCKQQTLNKYLQLMDIEYAGNQSGYQYPKSKKTLSLTDYLLVSADIQSNKVRNKLLNEKIKEHKCECCGLKEWMGKPIPLELHHIDGDKKNNTLDNFMLLCPNCHAMTDSYRGKNIRKNKCVETIYQPPKS